MPAMVIGYHLVLGMYGFWLPNDPRGSGSEEVWAEHLRPFGEATKVATRRSLAQEEHDRARRLEAKRQLKHPAVHLTGVQARAIAGGFQHIVEKIEFNVYSCSIMPDHVHMVIGRHRLAIEKIAGYLKRAGTRGLNAEGLHPFEKHRQPNGRVPSPWAEGEWKVFLDTVGQMRQRIEYVEENPVKEGLRRQQWPFVIPYDPGV